MNINKINGVSLFLQYSCCLYCFPYKVAAGKYADVLALAKHLSLAYNEIATILFGEVWPFGSPKTQVDGTFIVCNGYCSSLSLVKVAGHYNGHAREHFH